MSVSSSSSKPRIQLLDALRGIAVLMVIGSHIAFFPQNPPAFIAVPLLIWINAGWIGVDLFFVISGFLVSGLLFSEYKRTGSINIWRFLVRRWLRLSPPFYLVILVTAIFGLLGLWNKPAIESILVEVLYVQNYLPDIRMWNHTWTLAVEEHFYLFLVALIALFLRWYSGKLSQPIFPLLLFVIVVVVATNRVLTAQACDAGQWACVFRLTHCRIDSLLMGVILRWVFEFRTPRPGGIIHLLLGFAVFIATCSFAAVVSLTDPFMYSYGLSILALGFTISLYLGLVSDRVAWLHTLPMRAFAQIGRHSYATYLWHMPMFVLAKEIFDYQGTQFYVATVFYIGGSIVVGALFTRYVEQPTLRWRDRKFPSLAQ